MSKINIEVILKTNDCDSIEKYSALKRENKIIYQEKSFKTTLVLDSIFKMKRENDEYLFYLEFESDKITKGYCLIKKYNKQIDLDIMTDYVIIEEDLIILKYKIITTEQVVVFKLNLSKK